MFQCCALTDMPKLFVTPFLFSVMRKTIGCLPLANTLLLKQITETFTLIALGGNFRFALRFTPTAILALF